MKMELKMRPNYFTKNLLPMNNKIILFIISLIVLSSCAGGNKSTKLLGDIKSELKNKHAISDGDIVAKFDLQKLSKSEKLMAPYYGKIINSSISNKKFLSDVNDSIKSKNIIQDNSFHKIGNLSILLANLYKKHKILPRKSMKTIVKIAKFYNKNKLTAPEKHDYLQQLAKLHNSTKHIPILVPINKPVITSNFGSRTNPFTKRQSMHSGLDLAGKLNSEIYASADGYVEQVSCVKGYGNMIILKHNDNIKTRYAHLSKFNVKQGETVIMGQSLGIQGRTGSSTGHHLHFEVIINGKAINPKDFISDSL
jgi:murein DD-endopeptidase MepM/ murein hydrolase activator NlpD